MLMAKPVCGFLCSRTSIWAPWLINRGFIASSDERVAGGANSAGQSSADCHGMAAVGFDSCLGRTGMVERLAQARSANKHFPNVCNVSAWPAELRLEPGQPASSACALASACRMKSTGGMQPLGSDWLSCCCWVTCTLFREFESLTRPQETGNALLMPQFAMAQNASTKD